MSDTFDPNLCRILREAHSIAILTGAGISAESGVPTFRDALTGYWANRNPADLATPEAFMRDPELVSRWYDQRRCQLASVKPNAGHVALAELQRLAGAEGRRFTLITQNVDGLHERAGSIGVINLHGSLSRWRCIRCAEEKPEHGPAFNEYPVRCACGGLRRPGVVWFGEALPADALRAAENASRTCDLFLSIGTSAVVYPAAGLIDLALANAARFVEINLEPTPYSDRADWRLAAPAGAVLPALISASNRQ